MTISKFLYLMLCVFAISACSHTKKDSDAEPDNVDKMYNEAIDNLEQKKYDKSIEKFEELERTYPYSKWATKSEIMSAYASYKDQKYDEALVTLERYIKLHPGNPDVAYAYYLRALCYYEQISDVTKDQSYSSYAKTAIEEVIARFPETKYAVDAKFKLDLVNDHLAGKEVEVGRFYLKQGDNIGAINRFQVVIKDYDTTSHVPEALHRLVEAYVSLGVKDEAQKYAAVLGYNFPESKWYERSYKLLEGEKPASGAAEGKWYNYKNWKGLIFKKKQFEDPRSYTSKDLVEDLSSKVDGDGREIAKPTAENESVMHKISGWFKGLKLPFMGK
jgi:outer membrane protein assembly factor BamD